MTGGRHQKHHSGDEWQPATSQPGELYTIEGEIRSLGAFWRGLARRDPRNRRYQRDMMRSALMVIGMLVAVIVVIALVSAVL